MNLDEAYALCNSRRDIHFCADEGFNCLVCLDINGESRWLDDRQLQLQADFANSIEQKFLCEAALMVLRDKVLRNAMKARREAVLQ